MKIWMLTAILAASCLAAEDREAPPPLGTPKAFALPETTSLTLKNAALTS